MAIQRSPADPYLFSIPQKLGGKKEIIFLLTRSAVSNPLSELCLCNVEMKQEMNRFCGEALKREEKRRDGEFFQKALQEISFNGKEPEC